MNEFTFPSETHITSSSEDKLERGILVESVVENILTKMQLPNTFGIYGDWGTGKSTFLHLTEEYIRTKHELDSELHVIHFQPWKYEYAKSKDLLFALLKEIKESMKVPKASWTKLATVVSASSLGMAHSLFANSLKFISKGLLDIDDMEKKAELWNQKPEIIAEEQEAWIDEFRSINKLFKNFVTAGLKETKKKKLIVFVDDLDRCLPETAIHLLEAVKNFLYQENVLFVFAIDHRVVSEMIEKRYGLHVGYGNEYLEKIVNYHIELPRSNFLQIYETILERHGIELPDKAKARILDFVQEFMPESRRAKRILNQFAMMKYTQPSFGDVLQDFEKTQYAFLATYLNVRYPKHFSGSGDRIVSKIQFVCNSLKVRISPKGTQNYTTFLDQDRSFSAQELSHLHGVVKFQFNHANGNRSIKDESTKMKEGFESIGLIK